MTAGPWLAETLQSAARAGRRRRRSRPGAARHAAPLSEAPACSGCICCRGSGSGACLADDMGLGKTIQVLALLLVQAGAGRGAAARACWWRRPRCSPTGRRRSSTSRPT